MNQRQQHSEETKNHVLEFALEQFMRHGVKSVKVDDLATDLGMSKRTLYEMFDDKETLVLECLVQYHERKKIEFHRMKSESENLIETYVRHYLTRIEEVRDLNPKFLEEIRKYERVKTMFDTHHKRLIETGRLFLQECVDCGLLRSDINYDLVSRMADITAHAIMESELYKEYSFEEQFLSLDLPYLRGMCTEKGLLALETCMKKYKLNENENDNDNENDVTK